MERVTESRILDLITEAVLRLKRGEEDAPAEVWYRVMSDGERLAFDLFCVRVGDVVSTQYSSGFRRFQTRVSRMAFPDQDPEDVGMELTDRERHDMALKEIGSLEVRARELRNSIPTDSVVIEGVRHFGQESGDRLRKIEEESEDAISRAIAREYRIEEAKRVRIDVVVFPPSGPTVRIESGRVSREEVDQDIERVRSWDGWGRVVAGPQSFGHEIDEVEAQRLEDAEDDIPFTADARAMREGGQA